MGVLQGPDSCLDLLSVVTVLFLTFRCRGFEHLRMLEVQNESILNLQSCSVNGGVEGVGEVVFGVCFRFFYTQITFCWPLWFHLRSRSMDS